MRFSARSGLLKPFRVMAILARARVLEAQGRDIVHMEIGEPDFPSPPRILEAGRRALAAGEVRYTPAGGLPELREAVASFYESRYGIRMDPARIFMTPGASGALALVTALVVDPGDQVILADPGYPCYPNFIEAMGGEPNWVPVDDLSGFNLTPALMESHWTDRTRGIVLASPANPTGAVMPPEVLHGLVEQVRLRSGFLISDEIYHGLTYGCRASSALEADDQAWVINSFSKYFGMTGWRLGWVVVPESAQELAERYAQNFFISAPTTSQVAALEAFSEVNLLELEARRAEFELRRDFLVKGLKDLGVSVPVAPEGAFYVYADVSRFTDDSEALAQALLEEAGVATTPGSDFGCFEAHRYIRFCYTARIERLAEGLERLGRYLGTRG